MILYCILGDFFIVNVLIVVVENGKQVVVLVEFKVCFDEENNINWVRKLEQYGVYVVYGLVGLKIYIKIVFVVCQEGFDICCYVYIGIGNYNFKIVKFYIDLGLIICCLELGNDLINLFNFFIGYFC